MISYSTPVCPTTQRPASVFCVADNCTQPAFLRLQSKRGDQPQTQIEWEMNLWEAVFPAVSRTIATLEKQDKQYADRVAKGRPIKPSAIHTAVETRATSHKSGREVLTPIQKGETDGIQISV